MITNTRQHLDKIVAEGKLILIKHTPGVVDGIVYLNAIGYKPIIISETEKIEVGDWVYGGNKSSMIQIKDDIHLKYLINASEKYPQYKFNKILALPEQFSPQQLQDIADGKLKDGDKVLVECSIYLNYDKNCNCEGGIRTKNGITGNICRKCNPINLYKIKLNDQGHMILHEPFNKSIDRERDKMFNFGMRYGRTSILANELMNENGWYSREQLKELLSEYYEDVVRPSIIKGQETQTIESWFNESINNGKYK